ncbi:MAG TPA: redoxin domain-containing protein [Thermoanaerobaculia bacterium]|jgi:peroxiredoxin|nr:redoxin domain-containing protein [Thermoanaerobaculia bacterium]
MTTILLTFWLAARQRMEISVPAHVGNGAPPFSLYDDGGRLRALSELEGHAALVVIFATAPQAREHRKSLADLVCRHAGSDVKFLLVDVTRDTTPARARKEYAPYHWSMPVLFDDQGVVRRQYEVAGSTPLALVVDGATVIRYRGPLGGPLRTAIDQLLAAASRRQAYSTGTSFATPNASLKTITFPRADEKNGAAVDDGSDAWQLWGHPLAGGSRQSGTDTLVCAGARATYTDTRSNPFSCDCSSMTPTEICERPGWRTTLTRKVSSLSPARVRASAGQ